MNKKRSLASEATDKLINGGVLYEGPVHEDALYWRLHPDGYCSGETLESKLALLTEENLTNIRDKYTPAPGMLFEDVWRRFGVLGFLKCEPKSLRIEGDRVPTLRIRHDSYLHWMRGYGFQNSYDAYANGSRGCSQGLKFDLDFIAGSKDKVLNRALILSHLYEACAGQRSFYNAMTWYRGVVDQFINDTDDSVMGHILDHTVVIENVRAACASSEPLKSYVLELAVVPGKGSCVAALVRFGLDGVELLYSVGGNHRRLTMHFPVWDSEAYEEALLELGDLNAGHPDAYDEVTYLQYMWRRLFILLAEVADIHVTSMYMYTGSEEYFDTAPSSLYPATNVVHSMEQVDTALIDKSREYRSFTGYKEHLYQ